MIPGLLPIFLHGCEIILEWPGDKATIIHRDKTNQCLLIFPPLLPWPHMPHPWCSPQWRSSGPQPQGTAQWPVARTGSASPPPEHRGTLYASSWARPWYSPPEPTRTCTQQTTWCEQLDGSNCSSLMSVSTTWGWHYNGHSSVIQTFLTSEHLWSHVFKYKMKVTSCCIYTWTTNTLYTGFSLEIHFQMVHTCNLIARYETPSLHTAIEMLSRKPG